MCKPKSGWALPVSFILAVVLLVACSDDDGATNPQEDIDIVVGVLGPQTGDYASGGVMMSAALELAAEDLNDSFESAGEPYRVTLQLGDTQTSPNTARALLNTFVGQGIDLFVGPMTSAELSEVASSGSMSDALVISPSSTSPSQAQANDHVFRLVTCDDMMATALAEAMWQSGVRAMVSVYRPDDWGMSVSSLVAQAFEAKGGEVLASLEYIPFRRTFVESALDSLRTLINTVNTPADQIALQLSCFDDGAMFFEYAATDPVFAEIQWFGSDGFVQNSDLLTIPALAQYAAQVGYTAPVYGIAPTAETAAFTERFETATNGITPNSYAMLSYDALMVAVNAKASVGMDASVDDLATAFATEAASHEGLTGACSLNENGDRAEGIYYFWRVVESAPDFSWQHVMTWSDGTILE